MTTKSAKRKTRKVKTLGVKSVAADKATRVKGGPTMGPWKRNSVTVQTGRE